MQRGGTFQLVMGQGPRPGQIFEFPHTTISIGRDPGNQVSINDPQVSRQHARITPQGGLMILEDLGSTNGTMVNGIAISGPHALAHGDEIRLGDNVTLIFYGQPASTMDKTMAAPPPQASAAPEPTPRATESVPVEPVQPAYTPSTAYEAPPAYPAPQEYAAYPEEVYDDYYDEEALGRNWVMVGLGCLLVAIIVMLLLALWLYFLAPASIVDPIADFMNGLGIDVCEIVSCG